MIILFLFGCSDEEYNFDYKISTEETNLYIKGNIDSKKVPNGHFIFSYNNDDFIYSGNYNNGFKHGKWVYEYNNYIDTIDWHIFEKGIFKFSLPSSRWETIDKKDYIYYGFIKNEKKLITERFQVRNHDLEIGFNEFKELYYNRFFKALDVKESKDHSIMINKSFKGRDLSLSEFVLANKDNKLSHAYVFLAEIEEGKSFLEIIMVSTESEPIFKKNIFEGVLYDFCYNNRLILKDKWFLDPLGRI